MRFPSPTKLLVLLGLLVSAAAAADPVSGTTANPDTRVLRHATLLDGTGAPPRAGMTLVLHAGKIAAIYPDDSRPLPAGAPMHVDDLAGAFVLPGLIDTHVHLATTPSGEDRRDRVERRLSAAVRGGVVLVRDMGGDARALADLARASAAGDLLAPELRYSAVMAGPDFFSDPRVLACSAGLLPGTAPWARALTRDADLRQIMAEARGTGATGIKLYADLDATVAAAAAAEAHRQGLRVWGHLTLFPARPSEVVTAGVEVVSHALLAFREVTAVLPGYRQRSELDMSSPIDHPALRRLWALMRQRGVLFEPTLAVSRWDKSGPATSPAVQRLRLERAGALVRAAHAAGVRIVAGTDGIIEDEPGAMPLLHDELTFLVENGGLTPMEALVAATSTAAEAAGARETHGTIAPGKAADLLILRSDPTTDIHHTRDILMVLRRGQPINASSR